MPNPASPARRIDPAGHVRPVSAAPPPRGDEPGRATRATPAPAALLCAWLAVSVTTLGSALVVPAGALATQPAVSTGSSSPRPGAVPAVPAGFEPTALTGQYALAATASPAPMTIDECSANERCVVAPAPRETADGSAEDDLPALAGAIAGAGKRAEPATTRNGVVTRPAKPATVLLRAGTYRLSGPLRVPSNVELRGGGITTTTLLLDGDRWRATGSNFMIKPDGAVAPGGENLIADLTLNGSCRIDAGAPDASVGSGAACDLIGNEAATKTGGIDTGDRWTVRQVRFTNLRQIRLRISGKRDVRVLDNRFDNWGGAWSGDQANVAAGAGATGTVVEYNQFDETARGSSIDFDDATAVTIRYNTVRASAAIRVARAVNDYGSIYLRGVTAAAVSANILHGAHIALRPNTRAGLIATTDDVTNPRGTSVVGNQVTDSFQHGITVTYDDYRDVDGEPHVLLPGGANVLSGNTVTRPAQSGILVYGCLAASKNARDTITGNTIVDAGFGGSTSFSTGCGNFDTAGIGISIGTGDAVYGNTVIDDQAVPTTWYGIHIGARNGKTSPVDPVLVDPSGRFGSNTATGTIGGVLRDAKLAPEPPTLLTAVRSGGSAVTLTWKEAYQTAAAAIGGYRIYRDGRVVATLPVGSATIPGNLLPDPASHLDAQLAGWTATAGATVGHTGFGAGLGDPEDAVGGAALTLTPGGGGGLGLPAGQVGALGPAVPVTVGETYTAVASLRAAASSRVVRSGIVWLDAAGTPVGAPASPKFGTPELGGSWTTTSYTAQAPAGAAGARLLVTVESATPGETHLVDRVGLVRGIATQTWTDQSAPAGSATYQVVAYRGVDCSAGAGGECSEAARITLS